MAMASPANIRSIIGLTDAKGILATGAGRLTGARLLRGGAATIVRSVSQRREIAGRCRSQNRCCRNRRNPGRSPARPRGRRYGLGAGRLRETIEGHPNVYRITDATNSRKLKCELTVAAG